MKTIGYMLYLSIILLLVLQTSNSMILPFDGNELNELNTTEYEIVYSWKIVEIASKKDKDNVLIDKIAIYTQIKNGLRYKYYYSMFNPQTKEVSIHYAIVSLFVIKSSHEVGHSIKLNEKLNLTQNMKIHNAKFALINSLLSKWLDDNQKSNLKYIYSIYSYDTSYEKQQTIYLIRAIVNNTSSPVLFILFEDQGKLSIIKSYE